MGKSRRKKFRVVPLLLAALLFGGCGDRKKGSDTPEAEDVAALFSADFTAETELTMNGLELSGEIRRSGEQTILMVTAPEHLDGLCFTMDGEKTDVSYKGLTVTADKMPGTAVGSVMTSALSALERADALTVTGEGEHASVAGSTTQGAFTLTFDGGTGMPAELSLPDAAFCCIFKKFSPAEKEETPSSAPSSEESSSESAPDSFPESEDAMQTM